MRWFLSLLVVFGLVVAGQAQSTVGGRTSPDGAEEIRCDLPAKYHIRNTGGTDGLGLCVWASLSMDGEWSGDKDAAQLFEKMKREKGGGWPEKVDVMMKKYCPHTQYLQSTGGNAVVLRSLLDGGRIGCITYGYGPRYVSRLNPRGEVSHMVCCVHLSAKWACVLDNNFPGPDKYEWMSSDELLKRWRYSSGGWVIGLAPPPPPPIPVNRVPHFVIGQLGDGRSPLPALYSPALAPTPAERWVEVSPGSDVFDVWQGNSYVGRRTLPARTAPTPTPAAPVTTSPTPAAADAGHVAELPTGADFGKIKGYGDSWCGKKITTGAVGAEAGPLAGIPDDKGWRYLTVIAPDSVRTSIVNRIVDSEALKPSLEKMKVRAFSPDDPLVRDVGLVVGTGTAVVLQDAEREDGKGVVLHRQGDVDDGPQGIGEAIRKADEHYVAAADPDLRKQPAPSPDKPVGADPWYLHPLLWAVIAGFASSTLGPAAGKAVMLLRGVLSARSGSDQFAALLAEMQQLRQVVQQLPPPPTPPTKTPG